MTHCENESSLSHKNNKAIVSYFEEKAHYPLKLLKNLTSLMIDDLEPPSSLQTF